jgi:hypothetical protein
MNFVKCKWSFDTKDKVLKGQEVVSPTGSEEGGVLTDGWGGRGLFYLAIWFCCNDFGRGEGVEEGRGISCCNTTFRGSVSIVALKVSGGGGRGVINCCTCGWMVSCVEHVNGWFLVLHMWLDGFLCCTCGWIVSSVAHVVGWFLV